MILKTENLVKKFDGITATDHLDFQLEEGNIEVVIGPNGAGKTTFFNLITGSIQPDKGRIVFDGDDVTDLPLHEVAHRGMVRKYQTPAIYENISVARNIAIAARNVHNEDRTQRVESILERIELEHAREIDAGELDHGNKQWLEIGMVLANDPKLILLDEPTAGMTAEETDKTADLIKEISEEENVSIIAIEHDMDFVRELAVPVTVLHRGNILATGTIEEIEENEKVQDVYLGGE